MRFANGYSVPGLAGLSFLRSIVRSLIGIEFATAKRAAGSPVLASDVAEGLEALACWHSRPARWMTYETQEMLDV